MDHLSLWFQALLRYVLDSQGSLTCTSWVHCPLHWWTKLFILPYRLLEVFKIQLNCYFFKLGSVLKPCLLLVPDLPLLIFSFFDRVLHRALEVKHRSKCPFQRVQKEEEKWTSRPMYQIIHFLNLCLFVSKCRLWYKYRTLR